MYEIITTLNKKNSVTKFMEVVTISIKFIDKYHDVQVFNRSLILEEVKSHPGILKTIIEDLENKVIEARGKNL